MGWKNTVRMRVLLIKFVGKIKVLIISTKTKKLFSFSCDKIAHYWWKFYINTSQLKHENKCAFNSNQYSDKL